ncbi:MAG: GatB/YqeY domain-containing protein [Actinobacteria bacterium]|nr:GatB/YqeY domain-containing protein [Actinomycetota bacterium]MCG2819388.1 GatB/YqeY domain-containing protein [Actinomycetes bacterium]MBU4219092.1 GatB/YqeY domain-containing protein [Actinomycetota bacterium]MBU4358379.1 GatB/YqeY domain-containing protein [Actinomycetota bacterium]MBU4390923.1 GatB/YqeY domain-containing protein [Actinomycetota bacterium]
MNTKERLRLDMKESLKAGEKLRLSTIRIMLSEIGNAEIAKRDELSEEEMVTVVTREAKRRKEAIEEYGKAGRQDLVDKESFEYSVIESYLPRQLEETEIRRMIEEAVEETGASSPGDLGKVMSAVMPRLKGKADGRTVNLMAREILGE